MFRFIVKDICYRPARNGALVMSFAIIAASLFSGNYLGAGAGEAIQREISRLGADMIIVPEQYRAESEDILLRGEPSTFFFDSDVITEVEQVPGVSRVAPQVFIATLPADCCSELVQLIAIDPSKDFTIAPWLARNGEHQLGKDEIITGSTITGETGSTQLYYGHAFTVAGKLEPTGTGIDETIFMRNDDARIMAEESRTTAYQPLEIPEGKISAALVKIEAQGKISDVAERLSSRIPGIHVITPLSLVSRIAGNLQSVTRLLGMAALVSLLASLPLTALITAMAVQERIREIGVLRALGATRTRIFLLIVTQSMVIAAAGGLLGVALSLIGIALFQDYISFVIGIPLAAPEWGTILSGTAAAVILTTAAGGIAAFFSAARAAMTEPYESLRSGGP